MQRLNISPPAMFDRDTRIQDTA